MDSFQADKEAAVKWITRIGILVALAGFGSAALGGGTIYEFDGSGNPIGSGTPFTTSDKTVSLDSNTRFVDIIPSSNSDDIPLLTFTGGPPTSGLDPTRRVGRVAQLAPTDGPHKPEW